MEGMGSRQSRASSRYGSSPAAPVFNGPVRKWKKQWVSSKPNNINGNNRNDSPPLLLCRWTPLSATATDDEPRKRRFRYTPVFGLYAVIFSFLVETPPLFLASVPYLIVPIEKGSTETLEKVLNEAKLSKNKLSKGGVNNRDASDVSNGDISTEETQDLSEDQSDSNKSLGQAFYSKDNRKNDSCRGGRISVGD